VRTNVCAVHPQVRVSGSALRVFLDLGGCILSSEGGSGVRSGVAEVCVARKQASDAATTHSAHLAWMPR
jgi:hypothetical protein